MSTTTEQDEVERAAEAIYEAKWPGRVYDALSDEKKDDFRRYARAAISAMPGRDGKALEPELKKAKAEGLREAAKIIDSNMPVLTNNGSAAVRRALNATSVALIAKADEVERG